MLRRLPGLFDRYAAARLAAARPGPVLRGPGGAVLGRVARVALVGRTVVVEGTARAESATLRQGEAADGARLGPDAAGVPFVLSIPAGEPGDLRLALTLQGGAEVHAPLPIPSAALARARLWLPFAWAALRVAPDALAWRRTRDPARRARVKRALAPDLDPGSRPIDAPALEPPSARLRPASPSTILVPVFDAFEALQECLDRVERHTDGPYRLLVVEDASRDARVRPWLRQRIDELRARGVVAELLENEANLGFVGAVNAGLDRARAIDPKAVVVLLNTDAMVPEGWLPRLLAPLLADPSVASVTPMSNDAEILSVPAICRRLDLAPGIADAIDREARRLDPVTASASLPTGVGFCMALAPAALARVPAFDTAFGRGYGEEVDWCQRLRAEGFRHVGTGALFVEHRGGGSFGSDAKRELIARHGAILSRRYPRYDGEVQRVIAGDSLATPRLALALAWAAAVAAAVAEAAPAPDGAVRLVLGHVMGGGAEMALARRAREDMAGGRPTVAIRVGGRGRWLLEVLGPDGAVAGGQTDDEAVLRRLLEPLRRRRIVYLCGVGDPDPVTLPPLLLSLAGDGAEVEVEVHDYFPISPSYTLLSARGTFAGPVAPGLPGADDPAHRSMRPDGSRVTLDRWQAAWRPLMVRARVTAFSEASADLVRAAYPEARIEVRPHAMIAAVERVERPAGPRVLGVLGNINAHKGSALVVALARLVAAEPGGLSRVVLVGDLDPEVARPRALTVHGAYRQAEIADLARRYRVTEWLIPSIWPETFSFTVREALATGLPTFAFAIGAQGEAVAEAPNGRPLPLPAEARAVRAAIESALPLSPGPKYPGGGAEGDGGRAP